MRISLWLITGLFSVSLLGCGNDPAPRVSRGGGGEASKKKEAPKAEAGPAFDESKLPPKLRNIDWSAEDDLASSMRETRDPFLPYVEDLLVKAEDQGGATPITQIKTTISDSTVDELQLIAIISGGAVHKAMVTDPRGLGHIVRPGDIVGHDPPMRVVRVTRNEVLFRALEVGPDEEKPKEVQKVLLSQEELQELLP